MAISEVRIHPAIGIARVGNSDTEFFIGPERRWDRSAPQGGYKDPQCRIKRQAARFRVFGYDNGVPVELTAATAKIEWTVHLVNRKAAVPAFLTDLPRNSGYEGDDRKGLIIDPGPRTLDGPDQRKEFDSGAFKLKNQPAAKVVLGEIRTDDEGRLLVLGGLGKSGSPSNAGLPYSYDNDEWHDDISDGPITATVTVAGQVFTAAGSWVIVGPPKYAPPIDNVLRLWDMLFDVFAQQDKKLQPEMPSYVDDIYPILQSAADAGAVVQSAIGHHKFAHPVPGSEKVVARLKSTGDDHMPDLSNETKDGRLNLTGSQIAAMEKWASGNVADDWDKTWGQAPPPDAIISPDGLDKAALENCVGGGFRPGIEVGKFLRDATKFLPLAMVNGVPSFRIDQSKVLPGEVTARMAVPWQADFWWCTGWWWPVPRPENVKLAGNAKPVDWLRSASDMDAFVAGKWNKMGFVTRQGDELLETDRCDTADTWVSLVTPALTFDDIPQGPMGSLVMASRAVVFEVRSPVPVTFNFAGPDASLAWFTAPPHTQPATGDALATVRLWLVYSPPSATHSVTTSVDISCPETEQTWTVPISANAVPRKEAAVALILDKSGSMMEDRGDGIGKTKSSSVRDAANTFIDMMLPGDSVSLTAFDGDASMLMSLSVLGDPGDPADEARVAAHGLIDGSGLDPGGDTSIGDGIFTGRATLSGATAKVQSLVVLTDGNENTKRWIADVADEIDQKTYAIGVGTAANVSAAALETICGNNGGYLLITGPALGGDNAFLLQKYFLQILAGISNAEVVLDPAGTIGPGQTQRIPIVVCEHDNLIDVVLLGEDQQQLELMLEAPSGQLVDPTGARNDGGRFVSTPRVAYYRLGLPFELRPDEPNHVGTWHAVVRQRRHIVQDLNRLGPRHPRASGRQRYSVMVHAWSDVAFSAAAHQRSFTPGAAVDLVADLTFAGIPFAANAHVRAEVTAPRGTLSMVELRPQDEQFHGSFVATIPGDYRIRLRAAGRTERGNPFTREKTLSVGVWRGGDAPPRGTPGDIGRATDDDRRRFATLLRDVLRTASADSKVLKRWRKLGLDPRDLEKYTLQRRADDR